MLCHLTDDARETRCLLVEGDAQVTADVHMGTRTQPVGLDTLNGGVLLRESSAERQGWYGGYFSHFQLVSLKA